MDWGKEVYPFVGKINSRAETDGNFRKIIKDTIREKININKESLKEKVKNSLRYLPIGISIGIGAVTSAFYGFIPGIIAATAVGFGSYSAVIYNADNTVSLRGLKVDNARNKLVDKICDIFAEECDNPSFFVRDKLSKQLTGKEEFLKYFTFGDDLAIKQEFQHLLRLEENIYKIIRSPGKHDKSWKQYNLKTLDTIRQRCLEELFEFTFSYFSEDIKKLANTYEKEILRRPTISTETKSMYFRVLLNIEMLTSFQDLTNQLQNKYSYFAKQLLSNKIYLELVCKD